MRSDTDHREQLDDFSEFMRRKLVEHRLPVDDACWDEIEPRMKSRSYRLAWWMGSSVAAAVIALLLLLYPFQREEKLNDKLEGNVVSSHVDEEKSSEDQAFPVEKVVSPKDKKGRQNKKLIAVVTGKQLQEKEDKHSDMPEGKQEPEKVPEVTQTLDDRVEKQSDEPEKQTTEKQSKQSDLYNYEAKKYHFSSGGKTSKKNGKWAVNAGFGTGGHVSLGNWDNDNVLNNDVSGPGTSLPPLIGTPPSFNSDGILSYKEYEYADCSLPLSFGVTVRKDFSRYLGLETGLVYTYLSSRLTKSGSVSYESKLDLHYLGIPVNLVVHLWQNPRWNIYLSGGLMAEKGLRAKQSEDRFWQGKYVHAVEKKGIHGMQWSLNFAAGASYRLYRDWSIYFEPRISHYFDSDQPVSIRTENSVIVGLGAGFRYEF